jgi:hypothetical protein
MLAQIVTNTAPDIAGDVIKLIHDFGYSVNPELVASILTFVFVIARVLRKALPTSVQAGSAGELLKHIALEVNPQTGASTAQPTTPVVPPTK